MPRGVYVRTDDTTEVLVWQQKSGKRASVTMMRGRERERGDAYPELRLALYIYKYLLLFFFSSCPCFPLVSSDPEENQSDESGCNESRHRAQDRLPSGAARFRRQFFILHHFVWQLIEIIYFWEGKRKPVKNIGPRCWINASVFTWFLGCGANTETLNFDIFPVGRHAWRGDGRQHQLSGDAARWHHWRLGGRTVHDGHARRDSGHGRRCRRAGQSWPSSGRSCYRNQTGRYVFVQIHQPSRSSYLCPNPRLCSRLWRRLSCCEKSICRRCVGVNHLSTK